MADVDSNRDIMVGFPQFLLDIHLDDGEQDSSQIKLSDASWDPTVAMCKEAGTMNVSSTSCPINSPFLNPNYDIDFQASSMPSKVLFSKYLTSHPDYGYENVWSIWTNEIALCGLYRSYICMHVDLHQCI